MHAAVPPAAYRSLLFVPGNRPERFDKACAAGADAVIVDLEDAVAPAEKLHARTVLATWLLEERRAAPPPVPVLVRINAADTEWFVDDLLLGAVAGVAGIVLPKAEHAETVARVRRAGAHAVLPLIETAIGFAGMQALAAAPGVQCLLFGSLDFQLDLGIPGDGIELMVFRSQMVLASRLAGIAPPVDGVTTAIDDAEALRRDTLHARSLGFGGKLCIHPKQVEAVNESFLPTQADLSWAQRVLAAAESAEGDAVAVDGRMVDRPVLARAQRIIEEGLRRKG